MALERAKERADRRRVRVSLQGELQFGGAPTDRREKNQE